jgi:protein-S-isoprenylcysteine O-methyltransferase Ste14
MSSSSLPILVIALAVSGYWLRVVQMAQRQKRRRGRAANFIPAEQTGRWNRLFWVPAVGVWVVHPFYTALATNDAPRVLAPLVHVPLGLKWLLAGVVVACVGFTTVCWRRMGKSWRMGIDPNEKTNLVVSGPYAYVRHPIYALSLAMMAATMAAIASPLMLAAGAVHLALLVWEARREESHLAALHGDTYRRYCSRVGRFVPSPVRRGTQVSQQAP